MIEYIKKSSLLSHYRVDKENIHVVDCDVIYGLAAEDVRPECHGYWINEPDRYFHWHCSECGYVISGPHREFNYCPKCGTKMHGDK